MLADCTVPYLNDVVGEEPRIPILRGTRGLWKQYPAIRKQALLFEELVDL